MSKWTAGELEWYRHFVGSDVCGCYDGHDGYEGCDGFDGSDGSDGFGCGFDGSSMASMAWMDLMAPELKSEIEKSALVWRALVALHSSYQALCFAFVQMPS